MPADLAVFPPHTAADRFQPHTTAARRNPATQARHLHPAALPQWRALLEFCWQERLERVTQLSLAYHDAEEAAASAASGGGGAGARLAARRRASATLHRAVAERRALAEIEEALSRLAAGRFGWCEQCGSAITITRLNQMPQTRYCAACNR
jgi:RNA polymerase-binding transcription factor DksA